MKRRRQLLQVSTFPFLAVLLCAMGSLILLLLVIDRRAKVVARSKALEAVKQAVAEDEKAAAASRAEWELRRQALHELLNQENSQVVAKINSFQEQLATAVRDLQVEQGRDRELLEQIQVEKTRLSRKEEELAIQARTATQASQQSEAARSELARLTADLRKMEQTLEDLRAVRQRQQQTYSLVPYRGKRGDNRRPLYLDCAAGGLIFHPDHLTVPVGETTPVRAEVERRLSAKAKPASGEPEVPYLLFLIRPNGILTYYQTLTALNGLKLDFGYEFIEPDWVLNFPEDDKTPAPQPLMVADEKAIGGELTERRGDRVGQPFRTVHGIPPRSHGAPDQVGSGSRPEPAGGPWASGASGGAAKQGYGGGMTTPQRSELGSAGSPGGGEGMTSRRPSDKSRLLSGPASQAVPAISTRNEGSPRPGSELETGVGMPTPPPTPTLPQIGGGKGGGLAGNSGGAVVAPFRASEASLPRFGSQRQNGESSAGLTLSGAAGGGGMPAPPPTPPLPQIGGGKGGGLTGMPGGGLGMARTSTSPSPIIQNPQREGVMGDGSDRGTGPPSLPGQNSQGPGSTEGQPGTGESSAGSPGLLDSLPPSEPSKKKSSSLPPVRRWISRDWDIFIECRADGVVLYPGGLSIAAAKSSANGKISDHPLPAAVQQMIARRQSIIGEAAGNEPMGQPHIRFLVRPDGLRSYYQAYPELGGLQLQMTRENLEPDDDVTRHLISR